MFYPTLQTLHRENSSNNTLIFYKPTFRICHILNNQWSLNNITRHSTVSNKNSANNEIAGSSNIYLTAVFGVLQVSKQPAALNIAVPAHPSRSYTFSISIAKSLEPIYLIGFSLQSIVTADGIINILFSAGCVTHLWLSVWWVCAPLVLWEEESVHMREGDSLCIGTWPGRYTHPCLRPSRSNYYYGLPETCANLVLAGARAGKNGSGRVVEHVAIELVVRELLAQAMFAFNMRDYLPELIAILLLEFMYIMEDQYDQPFANLLTISRKLKNQLYESANNHYTLSMLWLYWLSIEVFSFIPHISQLFPINKKLVLHEAQFNLRLLLIIKNENVYFLVIFRPRRKLQFEFRRDTFIHRIRFFVSGVFFLLLLFWKEWFAVILWSCDLVNAWLCVQFSCCVYTDCWLWWWSFGAVRQWKQLSSALNTNDKHWKNVLHHHQCGQGRTITEEFQNRHIKIF